MRVKPLLIALVGRTAAAAPAPRRATPTRQRRCFKVGWAQDPQTLSPSSTRTRRTSVSGRSTTTCSSISARRTSARGPASPKSWTISPDKKTVTFNLVPGPKWSDGQPITTKDVKYSLDSPRPTAPCSPATRQRHSITTPDDTDGIVKTKKPDARIVGGLFIYILPQHVWGSTGQEAHDHVPAGDADRRQRAVHVSEFNRNRIIRMMRNPNFRGRSRTSTRSSGSSTATATRSTARYRWARSTWSPRSSRRRSPGWASRRASRRSRRHRRRSPSSRSTSAPSSSARTRSSTRRSRTAPSARRSRTGSTATVSTRSPAGAPRSPATGSCPTTTRTSTSNPRTTTRTTRRRRSRCSTRPAGSPAATASARRAASALSFNLYVRSESQADITATRLVKEMAKAIGVDFKVQVVSVEYSGQLSAGSISIFSLCTILITLLH